MVHRGQCDLAKPDCSLKGRLKGEFCECPMGHSVPKCDKCMPNFWAYTSFGCRGEDHLKDLSVILFVKIGLWKEVGMTSRGQPLIPVLFFSLR